MKDSHENKMGLLTEDMANFLKKQKLGFVATVSPDNLPNVSPKGTIVVWDPENLAFADIRSPDTMKNLESNPNLEINVIDPISRKGFLFRGRASLLKDGSLYDEILRHYRDSGVASPIGIIALVKIEEVQEVLSPLYDLGTTEEQMREKWTKHYLK